MNKMNELAVKVHLKGMRKKAEAMQKLNGILTKKKIGSMQLDFLIIILLVVIVGALLLGLAKTAFPDLFNSVIKKVKSVFSAGLA